MIISNNLNSYKANLYNKNIRNLNTTSFLNTTSSQNLVKDKSEAVSEILGYEVDKEGFLTVDFNEKAGLPKDFKLRKRSKKSEIFFKEFPFLHLKFSFLHIV